MSILSFNHSALVAISKHATAFSNNKNVRAINDGLINLIPLVLVGAFCVAFSNMPVPIFHDFLNGITGNHWTLVSQLVTFATADIIGLAALVSVSFSFATQSSTIAKGEINVFLPVFTAFSCYMVLCVWDPEIAAQQIRLVSTEVIFPNPGRTGVFYAIFVAVTATKLFSLFSKLWLKLRGSRRGEITSNLTLRSAMRSIFPVICTLIVFVAGKLLIGQVMLSTYIDEFFAQAAQALITNGDFVSVIISVLLIQVLWFFGAHGTEAMLSLLPQHDSVTDNVANAAVGITTFVAQGPIDSSTQALQQTVVSEEFFAVFVSLGGAGTTLGLLIALFALGSVGRGKKLARISVLPSIFNVNETLLYGIPIVLNPFLILPFILAPVVSAAISYGAFALGLVPPISNYVFATTPIFLSGYLETGSIAGAVLQLVCLAASVLAYAPFVVMNKNSYARQEETLAKELFAAATEAAENEHQNIVARQDAIGEIARDFTAELNEYFDNGIIPFRLVYQPKSDKVGRVVGAEALLRWTHPRFGPISPVALIEMTDEANLTTPLGRWITKQSIEEYNRWKSLGIKDLLLSLNLNPRHLFEDPEFPTYVTELIAELDIAPSEIEMEITEHVAVHSSDAMLKMFTQIRDLGIGLSIDDMGMGYSSLTYISDFGVGAVKIDISLIDKVVDNKQQQEIVSSIIELARQLDLAVIVEGVEEKDQLDALVKLGCHYFQGYYFSKPLEKDEFIDYVHLHGTAPLLHGV